MIDLKTGRTNGTKHQDATTYFGFQMRPISRLFGLPGRQWTCIGGFANVYISQEVENNKFGIAGGEPGMKVSWMLTGVRKDAYAEQNRIQVEVEKDASERGTYIHPEAFGASN